MQEATALAGPDKARLRVVVADPDPLARHAVCRELCRQDDFVVTAQAANGKEAIELCCVHRPEVLVCETALPGLDGIGVALKMNELVPDVGVVIFANSSDAGNQLRLLRAGVRGYLYKDGGVAPLPRALRAVARGEAAIPRALTTLLVERLRVRSDVGGGMRPVKSELTTREWEILEQLARGATTAEMAGRLFLAESTVYGHVKSIKRKLDVRSRAEAVEAANRLIRLARPL